MGFKGFDKIANLDYKQRIFRCDKCENRCDVTEIKTEDSILYHGDRCERYSGVGKKKSKINFPNLFEEREKILMSYQRENKERRKTIGIPRVGLFSELFPFWQVFFDELGYNVEISKKTNKKIIEEGLGKTTAEFCFPFKVAFGHHFSLDNKVDFIFVPDIIEGYRSKFECHGEIKDTEWDKSYTCPYLQNIGAVVARNTIEKTPIINPHISLRGNRNALIDNLTEAFGSSGEKIKKMEVERAVDLAEDEYFDFKRRLSVGGIEALENLEEKEKGVVIVGRAYSTYDEALNLNLAKKILENDFLSIPMDYLPFPEKDLSQKWKNEFSIQGQLILSAASVIKEEGLNAVFLDYFGCGPNSFLKGFFAKEIGKPYLTLQIDEHTADAGLVTRLEAFLDSVK